MAGLIRSSWNATAITREVPSPHDDCPHTCVKVISGGRAGPARQAARGHERAAPITGGAQRRTTLLLSSLGSWSEASDTNPPPSPCGRRSVRGAYLRDAYLRDAELDAGDWTLGPQLAYRRADRGRGHGTTHLRKKLCMTRCGVLSSTAHLGLAMAMNIVCACGMRGLAVTIAARHIVGTPRLTCTSRMSTRCTLTACSLHALRVVRAHGRRPSTPPRVVSAPASPHRRRCTRLDPAAADPLGWAARAPPTPATGPRYPAAVSLCRRGDGGVVPPHGANHVPFARCEMLHSQTLTKKARTKRVLF